MSENVTITQTHSTNGYQYPQFKNEDYVLIPLTKRYRVRINSPKDVYKILWYWLSNRHVIDRDKEHFFSIGIKRNNEVAYICYIEVVSIGTLSGTLVSSREVFRRTLFKQAVKCGVNSLIIAHNHPSGNLNPSKPDVTLTRKLVKAGEIMDIPIIDHVIFSKDGFYSFANEGHI